MDADGNDASLAIPAGALFANGSNIVVDTTHPTAAVILIGQVSGNGTFTGTGTLTATVTSNGSPVSGVTVTFTLTAGTTTATAGSATTNAKVVATLRNVSLGGFNVGTYPGAVGVNVASNSNYTGSSAVGDLTVIPVPGSTDGHGHRSPSLRLPLDADHARPDL